MTTAVPICIHLRCGTTLWYLVSEESARGIAEAIYRGSDCRLLIRTPDEWMIILRVEQITYMEVITPEKQEPDDTVSKVEIKDA